MNFHISGHLTDLNTAIKESGQRVLAKTLLNVRNKVKIYW